MPPTLRFAKQIKTMNEYHRLLLDYEVLIRCIQTTIPDVMKKFTEHFEDIHQRQKQYVNIRDI